MHLHFFHHEVDLVLVWTKFVGSVFGIFEGFVNILFVLLEKGWFKICFLFSILGPEVWPSFGPNIYICRKNNLKTHICPIYKSSKIANFKPTNYVRSNSKVDRGPHHWIGLSVCVRSLNLSSILMISGPTNLLPGIFSSLPIW